MTPHFEQGRIQIYLGSALKVLSELGSESVHCVVTSPPYWNLRDYQTGSWDGGDVECDHLQEPPRFNGAKQLSAQVSGHASKAEKNGRRECHKCGATRIDEQIGIEDTPDEYVGKLVTVFREVRRVLRNDGVMWLNIGDSYAAARGGTGMPAETLAGGVGGLGDGDSLRGRGERSTYNPKRDCQKYGLKHKDLVGIPWMLAFALRTDGWWLRQDIIWSKLNPMLESVTDRCTKAHEYVFLLSKADRYYYDADAIAEPFKSEVPQTLRDVKTEMYASKGRLTPLGGEPRTGYSERGTRNKRSVWEITAEPFPEAHFATFPTALVKPCILAGTSEKGCCSECGSPFRRVVESERVMRHELPKDDPNYRPARYPVKSSGADDYAKGGGQAFRFTETIGWEPTCTCFTEPLDEDNPSIVPCTVLDPFSGSGTTGLVVRDNGCKYIGIELNPEYIDISANRLAQNVLEFA